MEQRFVADAMLGRLARWLRLLGFDTLYFSEIADGELLSLAGREKRILLTRDTRLVEGKKTETFFIRDDGWRDQLAQFLGRYSFDESAMFSRCLGCNLKLLPVEKEKVKELVPPYVYLTQRSFSRCPGCLKIFWAATHAERVKAELEKLGLRQS
jgi:uncharacterized protein with PIN domain